MPILYTLNKQKDKFILEVQQDTEVVLNYVCIFKTEVYNDIIYDGNSLTLPVDKDGEYELLLDVEGETQVVENFSSIYNLQKSLIADINSFLKNCNYNCSCSEFSACVSQESKNALNNKDIYVKLLTFQNFYFPIIGTNLSNFFSEYLKQVVEQDSCNFQTAINTILKEECLYGNTISNSELFNKYLSYYYIGIYNIDKNIAIGDTEELVYIEEKYDIESLYTCFNNLCITVTEIETIFNNVTSSNTPPTINDFEIVSPNNLPNNLFSYTFDGSEFTDDFTDIQGNLPKNIKFFALPVRGDLEYEGNPAVIGVEYPYENIAELTYEVTVDVNENIFDLIIFQISDDNTNELYSDMAKVTMNTSAYVNQPISQLGDLTLSIDNRDTHVYTLSNFTTGLTPPYQDPEGDSLDAIRIDSLPTNGGVVKLSGVAVTLNQIIDAADINSGLLIFEAPNQNAAASVEFDFSARDTGSQTFVSS